MSKLLWQAGKALVTVGLALLLGATLVKGWETLEEWRKLARDLRIFTRNCVEGVDYSKPIVDPDEGK